MNSPRPRVTIGVPVYNEETHLAETLDSLLAQEFTDFELILSDNASTDKTGQIARRYAASDPRIQHIRHPSNLGAINNFQEIVRLGRGEYFFFVGGHDYAAPRFLGRCVEALDSDKSVVLAYTEAWWGNPEDQQKQSFGPQIDTRGMARGKRVSLVVRKAQSYQVYGLCRIETLRAVMPLRKTLGPDLLLLTELAMTGTFVFIPELLFCLRRTEDTDHLQKSLQKLRLDLGRVKSLRLIRGFFAGHLEIICKYCSSASERFTLSLLVVGYLLKRWHRLLLFTFMAGWTPHLLNRLLHLRGREAVVETS